MKTHEEYQGQQDHNSEEAFTAAKYFLLIAGMLVASGLAIGIYFKHLREQQRPAVPNGLELRAGETEPFTVNCGRAIYTITARLEEGFMKQELPIEIGCGRSILTTTAEIGENGIIRQTTKFGRK